MATLRRYVSDIQKLAGRFKVLRDTRIDDAYAANLIHDYRAKEIRDSASRNGNETDYTTWQSMGVVESTPVSSTDDPTLPNTCKDLRRLTIPVPVYVPGNMGLKLFTASGQKQIHEVSMEQFFDMPMDGIHAMFCYFYRIGLNVYLRGGDIKHVKPLLLLDNPLDGYIFNSDYVPSGKLIYQTSYNLAESYTVYENVIFHNTVQYNVGDSFTAVNPDFTGIGKVKLTTLKRRLNWDDEYPMSAVMFEVIKLKIFAQEFKIEKAEVANVINNAQDENQAT